MDGDPKLSSRGKRESGRLVPTDVDYDDTVSDEELQQLGVYFAAAYLLFTKLRVHIEDAVDVAGGGWRESGHDVWRASVRNYAINGALRKEVVADLERLFPGIVGRVFIGDSFVQLGVLSKNWVERKIHEEPDIIIEDMLAGLRRREDEVRAEEGLEPIDWNSDDL